MAPITTVLRDDRNGPATAQRDRCKLTTDSLDSGYTTFFRAEFAGVVRTIYLIVRDQSRAEDIAQEAFLQLLIHWPKVSRYEVPSSWVRRVAIRLAMRGMRRDRVWSAIKERIAPAPPESRLDPDIGAAIHRLPGRQRAAIALFYYEDRPVDEIARILGCSEPTVRVHLHRARRRLAEVLGGMPDGA
jgi:RNA polymerase sigma-70 factor (ECF subfamily)